MDGVLMAKKKEPKCVEFRFGKCYRTEDFPTEKDVYNDFGYGRMSKRQLTALITRARKAGLDELADVYQTIKEEE